MLKRISISEVVAPIDPVDRAGLSVRDESAAGVDQVQAAARDSRIPSPSPVGPGADSSDQPMFECHIGGCDRSYKVMQSSARRNGEGRFEISNDDEVLRARERTFWGDIVLSQLVCVKPVRSIVGRCALAAWPDDEGVIRFDYIWKKLRRVGLRAGAPGTAMPAVIQVRDADRAKGTRNLPSWDPAAELIMATDEDGVLRIQVESGIVIEARISGRSDWLRIDLGDLSVDAVKCVDLAPGSADGVEVWGTVPKSFQFESGGMARLSLLPRPGEIDAPDESIDVSIRQVGDFVFGGVTPWTSQEVASRGVSLRTHWNEHGVAGAIVPAADGARREISFLPSVDVKVTTIRVPASALEAAVVPFGLGNGIRSSGVCIGSARLDRGWSITTSTYDLGRSCAVVLRSGFDVVTLGYVSSLRDGAEFVPLDVAPSGTVSGRVLGSSDPSRAIVVEVRSDAGRGGWSIDMDRRASEWSSIAIADPNGRFLFKDVPVGDGAVVVWSVEPRRHAAEIARASVERSMWRTLTGGVAHLAMDIALKR